MRQRVIRLCLLGDFDLVIDEESVTLPRAEQRLLAYLACAERPVSRNGVVGTLWPDTETERAQASLRTCLWRVRRLGIALIRPVGHSLQLDPALTVDLRQGTQLAREGESLDVPEQIRLFGQDLLPHWFDEWLDSYRNHYRQLRIQALEEASRRLLVNGRPGAAVVMAGAAVAAEPLRDSAHWALIRAYAAEGNHSKTVEQFRLYTQVLETELGVTAPMTLAEILR